jgi:hypothetical protein
MFALGAGPVPGLILPELFAAPIRAKALSVAMCVHWVRTLIFNINFLQYSAVLNATALVPDS